jgi:hypothetical protein
MTHSAARTFTDAGVAWSEHDLNKGCGRSRGTLLELGDRLRIYHSPGLSIGRLELGKLQPAHQGPRADPRRLGGFVKVALSQQGSYGWFLLAGQHGIVRCHVLSALVSVLW